MTPKEFRDGTIGKRFDYDRFPVSNPYQCIDYFQGFLNAADIPVSILCALTGYVCDLWRLRDQYGYSNYFDYITDPAQLKPGDWCIWDRGSSHQLSHIAMFYCDKNGDPVELGQNQPYPYVTEKRTTWDILGALRPKCWKESPRGYAEYFSQDFAHVYKCGYPLNIRTGGDTSYSSLAVLPKGTRVQCWGYYHRDQFGCIWLYVTYKNMVGFCCYDYLQKVY